MTTVIAIQLGPTELLGRAGRCFYAANLLEDACRCFAGAGDDVRACLLKASSFDEEIPP